MPEYLPLPDGSFLTLKKGQDPKDAWAKAVEAYPEAFGVTKEEKEKPESGFIPALKAGAAGATGSAALLAGKLGIMDPAAAEAYNKQQEEYGRKVFAPTQESWGQAPFTHLKELAGGSLPYMLAPAAGALLAPEATLGAGLASLAQFTGTNLGRQVEEGKSLKDASLGSAALAAIPQAALDVVSLRMLPGIRQMFGKAGIELPTKVAEDIAKKGLTSTLGSYAAATGKAAGVEGLTEAAQQVFERLQAGLSLTDPQAREEYFQNFLGGAALGGALAPVGHAFERAGQRPVTKAPPAAGQPVGQPMAVPTAEGEIPEPTIKGAAETEAPETPEEIAAKPDKAAKKLAAEQRAFLAQYEEQQAQREAERAEYERIKAMSPEEYAAEQLGGVKVSKPKAPQPPADETGYYTEYPKPPATHEAYAAQQIALAKDREPDANVSTYLDYLMQDPEQARALLANRTPIPGVTAKQSEALLGGIKMQLKARETAAAKAETARVSTAQERARGLFEGQRRPEDVLGAGRNEEFLGAAREQEGVQTQTTVKPEREALQRIGSRNTPYLTANRDIETERALDKSVGDLVDTLPKTNGRITPGDVYLGLGTKKQDIRDLQAQLAVARMTGNRDLQEEIKRELNKQRPVASEAVLGSQDVRQADENLRSNVSWLKGGMPEMRQFEADADKYASEQRSTMLGLARLLNSKTVMVPGKREEQISDAKETYIAQHAAEIEARRKAFGLPPMEDWERAEARARALEGLNTLTNNWGQFEDPVISVKALQNISREAIYQNLYKAGQRKATAETERTAPTPKGTRYVTEGGKEMFVPDDRGPRIAAPDELTLTGQPRRKETDKENAIDTIDMVLRSVERRTRAEPTVSKRPPTKVGSMAALVDLFEQEENTGRSAKTDTASVELLQRLRDQLQTNNDPEFVSLAKETATRIAEGNIPNAFDVRDLGEMMAAHEEAGRSTTRPGATQEELQRTSAQPQKDLFPEAAVQVQRATPSNFQKMLDSKDVQGMRDAIEQQRKDNLEVLQSVAKAIPNLTNRLNQAKATYERKLKIAQKQVPAAKAFKKEFDEDLGVAQQTLMAWTAQKNKVELALKDLQDIRDLLSKEPSDMRFLINANKVLSQEPALRKQLEQSNLAIQNLENLVGSINATNEANQTLIKPAQRLAEKADKERLAAQEELTKLKNEANAQAQLEKRMADREKAAKEKAERIIGTPDEQYNAAIAAGQAGLGLPGERIERDTTALQKQVNGLRSKMGSISDRITKAKTEKAREKLEAQYDEVEATLYALPEKAPVKRTPLANRTAVDEAFEAEQARLARSKNEQLGFAAMLPPPPKPKTPSEIRREQAEKQRLERERNKQAGLSDELPNRVVGPTVKDIKTGRTSQAGKRKEVIGPSQAVTDRLIARRAELNELNRRKTFLETNNKPVPKALEASIKKAEKAVNQTRTAQNKIATEELATREALKTLQGRRIATEAKRATEAGEDFQFARGVETISPDLTKEQIDLLNKNDLVGALDSFADDKDTSKLNKIVAQRLAAMLGNTSIKIENRITDDKGAEVLGAATESGGLVRLSRNGGLSQEVLLHEGTHAATERVIVQYETDPSKLSEIQRVAVRELKALHAAIKNDPSITSASAKGDLSEFVAEVFSNRNLQEQLRNKKWRLSDAWKGFKSIIMRMLGVKDPETMLGAALQSVDALLTPTSIEEKAAKKKTASKLSQKDIAALHTGSNSMKQFAEQFGTTHIKQADRSVEDANRIGQGYLDDMYDKPLDYVAPADRLDYSVRAADGKPLDLDNPVHYIEAEPADFAMLKAQEDPGLRAREEFVLTSQRQKDLRALVLNMMNTPEFTYVEQALVAKAASKYAVLTDKAGKLKLGTIEPDNRHGVAVVSAEDAGRVIEELRAGKPLKQAFLDGMQKNADANAKKNERKNGWQKFEQSDTYTAAAELNAACAGTPWCTARTVDTARGHITKGDFYVYYKNGRPEVAVRMDGTDRIGEIRGNSPNQAISKEQESIAKQFLQSNNFKDTQKYITEFDRKQFLARLFKGETNYTVEELFNNPPPMKMDGSNTISDSTALNALRFNALDGYGIRPEPSENIVNALTKKIQTALNDAEAQGYYPTRSATLEADGFVMGPQKNKIVVPFSQVKGVNSLHAGSIAIRALENKPLSNLEYINKLAPFGSLTLPKIKQIKEVELHANATITVPKDAHISLVRGAGATNVTINGAEKIDAVKLLSVYGDLSALELTLPDTKYVGSLTPPTDNLQVKLYIRLSGLLKQAGINIKDYAFDGDDYSTFADDMNKIIDPFIDHLDEDVQELVRDEMENFLMDPEEQENVGTGEGHLKLFARSLLRAFNFETAAQGSPEKQEAANNLANALNESWGLKGYDRFGDFAGTLIAPKRVQETFTEAPESVRYARAQAAGFEDVLATAEQLIAKPATIRQRAEANLGLGFRTQWLDRLAPLEKVANEMLDSLRGTQMMYYLRMADQKMSFVQQAVGRGVPQVMEYTRKDGQKERLIESVDGPSLANVVDTLKETPGMNAEAANKLFTLYLAAKRGDRVGYDKLNFGVPEDQIRANVAKIEANEGVRAVFEKARDQYNAYNRDLMRFMAQTGALTPEEAQRLAKTNDYIPYYREENGNAMLVIGGEGTFKVGSLAEQPQLRQLIGGNQKIMDFLTSSVENTSMLVDMGLRNIATKNAMFELESLGLAQFLGGTPSGPDIVSFKDKGVDKYVQVKTDDAGIPATLLVKGMEGIPVNNSAIVKAMGGMSTLLRRSITINPLYSARQVFRDSVAAPLLSGANFSPVFGALKQIGESATREKLESRGIIGGQIFTGTNEDLSRILGELQAGKMGISQFIARAEAISMEADALTRRAQYDSYIAQGLSEMEATMMSLEAMNFNRKGVSPSARLASTLIPFFNAQLQSLDVLYRAVTGKMPMNERLDIQGKLLRRGALLAGTAIAYALLMQDDDTYKNATPDEKYGNFFIHIPGMKESLRVPVPFEVGYIFKSLPEAMVNIMNSKEGGEEALKAFKNIAIQTIPGGTSALMPAAAKPLLENLTGYSFYTGRQLETKAEQMEKAEFRFRDNTSELAKQIGALTGTSPIKVDNLIRGYTGSMGVAMVQAFNFAMPTAGTPEQAAKRLSDAPVIGPLFQPENAGGIAGAVYDRMTEINEVKRTYDKLIKDGRRAEANSFLQQNVEDYSKAAFAGNVQTQMNKITQAINAVKASNMPPAEKREQLEKLQNIRIQIASSVRGFL